jgi:2-C-methyl-D-erythritol 4-phosphate cytidylyltransferase
MSVQSNIWVIIPAAGIGQRMGGSRPKQYLELLNRPVLSHALYRFAQLPGVRAVTVALHQQDSYWPTIDKPGNLRLQTVAGGSERCHSVYNALLSLSEADNNDWVLVHDAARPCIQLADIFKLLQAVQDSPVGGLLALPLTDTVKKAGADGDVESTLERTSLWRAQTPQMFRYGLLKSALEQALANARLVTDEAQAVELAGYRPRLVAGSPDNIKITAPGDLRLAELYLRMQAEALIGQAGAT